MYRTGVYKLNGREIIIHGKIMEPTAEEPLLDVEASQSKPIARGAEEDRTAGICSRMVAAYESRLAERPLLTQSITSLILYGIGDALAQGITAWKIYRLHFSVPIYFDFARNLRALLYGGVFYPYPARMHYLFLEHIVVKRWETPSQYVPFVKMFIEQFVYWSYLSNAYYHGVLGALQGLSLLGIIYRIKETLWETLTAQWSFWIPAQLVNFRYVPVRHQVSACARARSFVSMFAVCLVRSRLTAMTVPSGAAHPWQLNFVLVVSLAWTTFLSLTFPPVSPITVPTSTAVQFIGASVKTGRTVQRLTRPTTVI